MSKTATIDTNELEPNTSFGGAEVWAESDNNGDLLVFQEITSREHETKLGDYVLRGETEEVLVVRESETDPDYVEFVCVNDGECVDSICVKNNLGETVDTGDFTPLSLIS